MQTVKISEFKARCLEILDRVARTGETLVITRRGCPLARVLPISPSSEGEWLGCLEGTARAIGNLVEPVVAPEEWEAVGE